VFGCAFSRFYRERIRDDEGSFIPTAAWAGALFDEGF
jgi:hypothetical protein